jgi:TusA-related sulfurtransferase
VVVLPAFGWYWYSQRTKGGKDIKIDSVRPPVCKEIGDTIQIIATDPGVLHDIPAWCKVHGHKVHKYFTYAGILYYEVSPINWTLISNSTRYFSCQQSFLGLRDLCINRNKIEIGDTIQIIATDPGVLHDIPAWCKVHGHKVLACDEKTDEIVLLWDFIL